MECFNQGQPQNKTQAKKSGLSHFKTVNTKAHFRQFCQMRTHQTWKRKEDLAWQMWMCWIVWMVLRTKGRWIADRKRKSELRQSPFYSANCSIYETDFLISNNLKNNLPYTQCAVWSKKTKRETNLQHIKTHEGQESNVCVISMKWAWRSTSKPIPKPNLWTI